MSRHTPDAKITRLVIMENPAGISAENPTAFLFCQCLACGTQAETAAQATSMAKPRHVKPQQPRYPSSLWRI